LIDAINEAETVPAAWRPAKVPSSTMKRVLPIILRGAEGSCRSILKLTEAGVGSGVRDCFSIARSVVETLINVCYILAEGDGTAARMERHAQQKVFRDLGRYSSVAGLQIWMRTGGQPNPDDIPGLNEALAEFTSKKDREITEWVSVNIEKRLEIIAARYGWPVQFPLQAAFFMIYRHSSEILHGTLYGTLFFISGLPIDGRPAKSISEAICNHLLMIYMQMLNSIEALMIAYAIEFDAYAFGDAARNVTNKLLDIPFLKGRAEPMPEKP
jgi:hypothetical protein